MHEDSLEKMVGAIMVTMFVCIGIVAVIGCAYIGIWLVREIMGML